MTRAGPVRSGAAGRPGAGRPRQPPRLWQRSDGVSLVEPYLSNILARRRDVWHGGNMAGEERVVGEEEREEAWRWGAGRGKRS
eukprot:471293-Hanusia_phi.AAC.2